MAQNDQLDTVLQDSRLSNDDWQSLADVLKLDEFDITLPKNEKRELINRELRHSYGHTFKNIFRDEYEPDYDEIIRATAKKLKLSVRAHHTIDELEDKILIEVIDRIKETIIKKEGEAAWEKIEEDVNNDIIKQYDEGNLPPGFLDELKKYKGGVLVALLLAGKLSGIAVYLVANQLFFAIARYLSLRIGVAVAGPIIGKSLAFLLGPAGWVFAALWLTYDIGNTNWKKVLPAAVIIIVLRKRFMYEV